MQALYLMAGDIKGYGKIISRCTETVGPYPGEVAHASALSLAR